MSPSFARLIGDAASPYQKANTAERIVETLATVDAMAYQVADVLDSMALDAGGALGAALAVWHNMMERPRTVAADGRELGTLAEIIGTPGNDVYCVRGGEREILVPAIEDAIAHVDLAAGTLTLRDLAGLLEP